MRFPVDTTWFSQEPGIKGKEHRWKQAASVAYGSITSSGVCLWQPWTGQEDWQADRLIISTKCSLWEDISASTALSMAVRETWGGKKTNAKKAKKINSRGKINSWWIFSLLGNIKHCKLFNLTTLMSQTRAGSCRRRHTCQVTKRETKRTSQLLKNQRGVKKVPLHVGERTETWDRMGTEPKRETCLCSPDTSWKTSCTHLSAASRAHKKQPRARGEAESTHLSEHHLLGRANSYDTAPLFICVYLIFTAMSCSPSILAKKNARQSEENGISLPFFSASI